MMLTDEFKTLRDKIKYKTYYQIDFVVDSFVDDCIHDITTMDAIPASKIVLQRVWVNIGKKWVTTQDPHKITMVDIAGYRNNLPDIVRIVEENTGLKRSTIVKILTESKRLDADFVRNPQKFIEKVIALINDKKKARIVDGIKYEKIGDDFFWTQKKFEDKEIIQCFTSNTIPATKSIYSHVIYDSETIELPFAERLIHNDDVKFFIKLPDWFKIDTPLGGYNPDRAVLYEKNWIEKLYFVLETKWSNQENQRRETENQKIKCAKKHFASLDTGVWYEVVSNFDEFIEKI